MPAAWIASVHCWHMKQRERNLMQRGRSSTIRNWARSGYSIGALIVLCFGHMAVEGRYQSLFMTKESDNGQQIRKEGIRESREGNEGAQGGEAQKRKFRKKGHQPQAGNRDRTFGSAPCRRKSARAEEKDIR